MASQALLAGAWTGLLRGPGQAVRPAWLSDRLPPDQVQWLHHTTEVGEYGLALDTAGMLAYDEVAISDEERGDMLALARAE
jgi:hypothetical protein